MVEPLTWVEAPPRIPRPYTSLDVIPVHDVSGQRFVGFQFIPDPCSFPNPVPQECYVQYGPAAGTAKTFGDVDNEVATDVFGAYQGIECFLNGGLDEFRAVAQRVLENGEYRIVDGRLTALLAAEAGTSVGTGTVAQAFGLLEATLAAQVPARGYIYASPAVITQAVAASLLIPNLDGTLYTYLGTPVVPISEPSIGLTVYASGPVNLWRSPVEVNDAADVAYNHGSAIAERLYSLSIECGAWKATVTPPAG